MWGIYETRKSGIFEKCIADAIDSDGFHAKLFSLQPPWEELCCGFYNKSFSRVSSSLQEKIQK